MVIPPPPIVASPLVQRRRIHDAQAADDLDDFEMLPFDTIVQDSDDEFLDCGTWDSDDDGLSTGAI
jgi:hypothetical protein